MTAHMNIPGKTQTTLRSNGSELMPWARMSFAHYFAVNRLWSR